PARLRVRAWLHPGRPRPAREHCAVERAAVAAVAVLLAGDGRLRHPELAPRRADAGPAPVAAAGGGRRRRRARLDRAVVALRRGHALAGRRRPRLLVGLDRPRRPDLARPRGRHAHATRAEPPGLRGPASAQARRAPAPAVAAAAGPAAGDLGGAGANQPTTMHSRP